MDGAIQKAGPLGSARELSGARTSLLDLSGWAVARRSLKNRHILHLIVPIQNQVIIVHWGFESENFIVRLGNA
jgi:hypothetical protein